ncbi:MAG: aminoglycoside N(3)-acetyltransferase [Anaerorhabdus sp.]
MDINKFKEVPLITKNDILKHLIELGVVAGMILEVHIEDSDFDHVVGGAQSVVDALMDAVGKGGTLLMPLKIKGNSEPSRWNKKMIAVEQIKELRLSIPAYNKHNSEVDGKNPVLDNFRRREEVEVSAHPSIPFMAWGKHAKFLCNRQSLHFPRSEESPLARLYELRGSVLLWGVSYEHCAMMHLGEYRADCRAIQLEGAAIEVEHKKVWKKYMDIDYQISDFEDIGKVLEGLNQVQEVKLGMTKIRLIRSDDVAAATSQYLEKKTVYRLYR